MRSTNVERNVSGDPTLATSARYSVRASSGLVSPCTPSTSASEIAHSAAPTADDSSNARHPHKSASRGPARAITTPSTTATTTRPLTRRSNVPTRGAAWIRMFAPMAWSRSSSTWAATITPAHALRTTPVVRAERVAVAVSGRATTAVSTALAATIGLYRRELRVVVARPRVRRIVSVGHVAPSQRVGTLPTDARRRAAGTRRGGRDTPRARAAPRRLRADRRRQRVDRWLPDHRAEPRCPGRDRAVTRLRRRLFHRLARRDKRSRVLHRLRRVARPRRPAAGRRAPRGPRPRPRPWPASR